MMTKKGNKKNAVPYCGMTLIREKPNIRHKFPKLLKNKKIPVDIDCENRYNLDRKVHKREHAFHNAER